MKETWSKKWKALLIWLSAYINFVAFALVGGYTIVKSEDEELKKTTKKVFVIALLFTIFSAFLTIYSNCMNFSMYYNETAHKVFNTFNCIYTILRVVTYAVFMLIEFFKKEDATVEAKKVESEK